MNTATKYNYRYLAQIDIEAITPLAIGSGDKDILTDSLVVKDINGLPYIPGSSISGVIRSFIDGIDKDAIFGFQNGNKGTGSKLVFSDGRIIGKTGEPVDGIYTSGHDEIADEFLEKFIFLPVRQHVRITASGSTEKGGKFDEQIVFKGTRFRFEIELKSETDEKEAFLNVLDVMSKTDFRLGGGTRSGFGKVKVVSCIWKSYDLAEADQRESYLSKSSSLKDVLDGEQYTSSASNGGIEYRLTLKPVDFMLFGSGTADDDADMTPVTESFIVWNNGRPSFRTANIVLPASSLKGALSHRTAYHYNKNRKEKEMPAPVFLDMIDMKSCSTYVGDQNPAVGCLFGTVTDKISRGRVLFEDIVLSSDKVRTYVQSHVNIDRFTGGAKDGALYQEKTIFGKGEVLETSIVLTDVADIDEDYINAFECAMKDLCDGLLPLGGGTNRGNGCFVGEVYKDGKPLI